VGYGAMLIEGLVGIMALVAAASMEPGDYFAINVPAAKYATLTFQGVQMVPVHLAGIEQAVGEVVTGRTGGAVSLAVGMAQIFAALPGMNALLAYWYHFAIMFEALFILTTIDSGTRVARFLLQEFMGRANPSFARADNIVAGSLATAAIVASWSYFIYTGQVNTIWPMFGVSNQLLASVALAVATSILINQGRQKYAWVTLAPLVFLGTNTLYGGYLNIVGNYYPLATGADAARHTEGWILTICTTVIMVLAVIVFANAIRGWLSVLGGNPAPATAETA
jgi:carbon starvation protein